MANEAMKDSSTYKYPRTLAEAFGPYEDGRVYRAFKPRSLVPLGVALALTLAAILGLVLAV